MSQSKCLLFSSPQDQIIKLSEALVHQKERTVIADPILSLILSSFLSLAFLDWLPTKSRTDSKIAPPYLETLKADYHPSLQPNS